MLRGEGVSITVKVTIPPCVVVQNRVFWLHQLLIHNITTAINDGDPSEFVALSGVAHLTIWL